MKVFEGRADAAGGRLDVYISKTLKILSRSQIKALNLIPFIDGKKKKLSYILKGGESLRLEWDEPPQLQLIPENIPLEIIYEDDDCVVINKPVGLVVHPGAGNHSGTLVNALLWRRGFSSNTAELRPYIVHRLDKDTSGVIIAAWNDNALRFLQVQFKERTARKTYAAIVHNHPKEGEGLIDTFLCRDSRDRKLFAVSASRGKRAVTRYKLVKSWIKEGREYSFLLLRPKTGRTHQLRVQLRHIGCPIAGDPLYGIKGEGQGLFLHALSLEITLPIGIRKKFKAVLPQRFRLDN